MPIWNDAADRDLRFLFVACSQLLLVQSFLSPVLPSKNRRQTARLHVQDRPNFSSRLERFYPGASPTVTDFSTKALGLQGPFLSAQGFVWRTWRSAFNASNLAPEFFGEGITLAEE